MLEKKSREHHGDMHVYIKFLLTGDVPQFAAWISLLFFALQLSCCPKMIKNDSSKHTAPVGDMFCHSKTFGWEILNKYCPRCSEPPLLCVAIWSKPLNSICTRFRVELRQFRAFQLILFFYISTKLFGMCRNMSLSGTVCLSDVFFIYHLSSVPSLCCVDCDVCLYVISKSLQ